MKVSKKVSVGGAFARKAPYEYEGREYEADIQHGDKVKILNEGSVVVGQFGEQHVFGIETRNGEKNVNMNQKSMNALIDEWGDETKEWVGKEVNVFMKKDVIAGKKVIVVYLATGGWRLDEWGDLSKEGYPTPEDEGIDIDAENF